MPTVTVMQYEGYGIPLIQGNSGINATDCVRWSGISRRGHVFPHNMEFPYKSGTFLDYDTWCAAMATAGVTIIRVKIGPGTNLTWGGKTYSVEPPPYSLYHIYDKFLDDADLNTLRSSQIPYGDMPTAAQWNNSNIKALFDACAAHGIRVWLALFSGHEFRTDRSVNWRYHAWNSGNYYLSGVRCEPIDRGFIATNTDIFTNATAITQAKHRIDFIYSLIGSSNVVCVWELMAELNWMMDPDEWGEPTWNSAMVDHVRNEITPWVQELALYLRSVDVYNRPIANSLMRYNTNDADWSADPDNYWNVQAEPMLVYPIDIPCTTYFLGGDFDDAQLKLLRTRQKSDPRMLVIHQYWPFATNQDPNTNETSPYLPSKKHEWMTICSGRWGVGPQRWPGFEENDKDDFIRGSYADPDYYAVIPGVAKTFRSYLKPDPRMMWLNASSWSSSVSSTNVDYINSWGNTENLNLFVNWTNTGAKTVTVTDVDNGSWTVRIFDWTDGALDATQNKLAALNTFSFTVNSGSWSEFRMVAYCSKD